MSTLASLRRTGHMIGVCWWLQLKLRSRSAFDGALAVVWPLFFATTAFLMFRLSNNPAALPTAAVGASIMGIWGATSTTAASMLQNERWSGTLELLVAAPAPISLVMIPMTLAMATIGVYSMIATLVWGRLVFGIPFAVEHPVSFGLGVFVTLVSIAMLGFLLSISAVRYRAAWALGSGLEEPVWLLCGFLVPLVLLPTWIHPLAYVLAPTWGVQAIKAATYGGSSTRGIVMCALLAIVYGVIGVWGSRYVLRSARANATLALS